MKGIYNKKAISCIVEPLKAISSVFNNKSVHVVYENSDNSMFISVVNQKKSVYSMYELNVNEVIKDYEKKVDEAGIWDVKLFTDILAKFQNEIYVDDVEIDCEKNKLIISCGKETTDFYFGQLQLFEDTRSKTKRLKTESLIEACKFSLTGSSLKKLMMNINVFVDQDYLTLFGSKGDSEVKVKLSASAGTISNQNISTIEDVQINEDFELTFPKEDIKGLLNCNDNFEIVVYTGAKDIISAIYKKDHYEMKFYFVPLAL